MLNVDGASELELHLPFPPALQETKHQAWYLCVTEGYAPQGYSVKGSESKERDLVGKLEFAEQRDHEEGNGLNQGRGWHVRKDCEEGSRM